MATLTEKIDSRETVTGERPSVTMHYILDGTSDDITAKTLLLNSTPTSNARSRGAPVGSDCFAIGHLLGITGSRIPTHTESHFQVDSTTSQGT